jgi:hypothetical protein
MKRVEVADLQNEIEGWLDNDEGRYNEAIMIGRSSASVQRAAHRFRIWHLGEFLGWRDMDMKRPCWIGATDEITKEDIEAVDWEEIARKYVEDDETETEEE